MTDWSAATAAAAAIAQGWTRDAGPGGAILIFDRDGLRSEACGGLADLDRALPFTADTATRYASISKHFLAATLFALDNAVPLADRLGEHLPDLAPALGAVGIGHALDMTGGLPDMMETALLLGVPYAAPLTRPVLFDFVRGLDALNFPTGSEISYSNTGYRLVQAALAARGIDYRAALSEHFFGPLGLTIMLPEDQSQPVPNLATGYWNSPDGWRRGSYGMHFSASGGLAGSARDLMLWTQALLADMPPVAGMLDRLATARHLADGRATGYGLGLAISTLGERSLVGHGGSLPGYKNHFLLDRETGAGVVVLTNREDTDAHGTALAIMAALHREPLPAAAPDLLPDGLFVTPAGDAWIEHARGTLTFLGAQDTLYADDDGWAVSRSAHLPMRLHAEGNDIVGEIGHAARRFIPVAADAALGGGWDGEWVCHDQHGRFAIQDGRLGIGAGPLYREMPLRPLGENLALTDHSEGPWRQRALLLRDGGTIRVITNRSRMLRFTRG